MADRSGDGLGAPAGRWYGIALSDTAILDPKPRALYVGAVTTLVIQDETGSNMTIVTTGYHPVRPAKCLSTGSAGVTNLYGLY